MDVIVDGVPYVRADSVSHNKIGIAITTHKAAGTRKFT